MSTQVTLEDLSIFDSVFVPPQEIPEEDTDERFIINEKRIDKLTVKRSRVKLTPAVCDICGLDILNLAYEQNRISTNNFKELPDNVKIMVSEAVLKHKAQYHSESEKLITNSRPKQWLSGKNSY